MIFNKLLQFKLIDTIFTLTLYNARNNNVAVGFFHISLPLPFFDKQFFFMLGACIT